MDLRMIRAYRANRRNQCDQDSQGGRIATRSGTGAGADTVAARPASSVGTSSTAGHQSMAFCWVIDWNGMKLLGAGDPSATVPLTAAEIPFRVAVIV